MSENFAMIDNKWFLNKEGETLLDRYSEYGLITHCFALCNLTVYEYYQLHLDSLFLTLNFTHNGNVKQINKIKYMVDLMIEDEYFSIGDLFGNDIKDNTIISNIIYSYYYDSPKSFFMVDKTDIVAIINYKGGRSVNRFKLFIYFLYLRFEIQNNGTAIVKNETTYRQLGLSDKTISNYNKILEDINLIRYCSTGYDKDNKKEKPNMYSSVKHLSTLKERLQGSYGDYDTLKLAKKERDLKRSTKLKGINKLSEVNKNEKQ